MTRRRSIIGALLLCALSVCAFGAASASAAGLTAVKCVKLGEGHKYKSSHCTTPAEGGEFETVALAEKTEGEGEAIGNTTLGTTVAGLKINVICEKMTASGNVVNVEEAGEMRAHGTNNVFVYSSCTAVLVSSPTKICQVQGTAPAAAVGEIKSNVLTSITEPEHWVKIKPEGETPFMKFNVLTGGATCFTKTNLAVEITGSIIGIASTEKHSHVTFTPATNGTGLKGNGGATTMESTVVGWMKGNPEETVGLETF